MSEESLPQVQSVYAQQRDTKDWFIKKSYPKIKVELPLNITTFVNNFKSFIKPVYEKVWTQNIDKKKSQNNYFRAGISQKVEKTLKEKKETDF